MEEKKQNASESEVEKREEKEKGKKKGKREDCIRSPHTFNNSNEWHIRENSFNIFIMALCQENSSIMVNPKRKKKDINKNNITDKNIIPRILQYFSLVPESI